MLLTGQFDALSSEQLPHLSPAMNFNWDNLPLLGLRHSKIFFKDFALFGLRIHEVNSQGLVLLFGPARQFSGRNVRRTPFSAVDGLLWSVIPYELTLSPSLSSYIYLQTLLPHYPCGNLIENIQDLMFLRCPCEYLRLEL